MDREGGDEVGRGAAMPMSTSRNVGVSGGAAA